MSTRWQTKRDTAANWTSNNPILLNGEWGYETDTGKAKIGNGSTAWTSLAYTVFPQNNVVITGGSITGITDLTVPDGGTGTSTGSITGTGALVFTAGGSNQNVTLTPSGSGYTILNGATGIGTVTPTRTLEVAGQVLINSTAPELDWHNPNANADGKRWRIVAGEAAENLLEFKVVNDALNASSNFMVVERSGITVTDISFPNGSVGVGTLTPNEKLEVAGKIRANTAFNLNGTDGATQAAAAGTTCIPTAIAGGIVTAQSQITYATDGTYNFDATSGKVSSITITKGMITAITTVP